MMDINYISQCLDQINNIYSDMLLTSNYCRKEQDISWNNYSPGIFSKILYAKEYEQLLDERQYSFLLKDKSFFQFYYEFSNEVLTKAKLCFYPYPISNREDMDALEEYFCESGTDILETYYYGLKELQEMGVVSTNNSHFRFDYDHNVESHCKSHAQYGGINSLRIPFNHIINPILFFEFIIKNSFDGYDSMKETIENSEQYRHAMSAASRRYTEVSEENGIHLQYRAL